MSKKSMIERIDSVLKLYAQTREDMKEIASSNKIKLSQFYLEAFHDFDDVFPVDKPLVLKEPDAKEIQETMLYFIDRTSKWTKKHKRT